jgi:hypothetical protein
MSTTPALGSLDERIQQTAQILGKSTEQVEKELTSILGPKSADWQGLVESEEYVKFGDLMKAFHDDSSQPSPIALVRKAVTVLRGFTEDSKDGALSPRMAELKKMFGINPTLKTVDSSDLLKAYVPDRASDPVTVELRNRYGDKAVVAFRPGTKEVAVDETIGYITDMAQGLPEQASIYVDGDLVRLYKIGSVPSEMLDEDPMFPGRPLVRNRSTVNQINWSGVTVDARQLIRVIVERGDINTNDRMASIDLARKAREEGIKEIKEMFPEAHLDYSDRKEDGSLPRLKIRINGQKGNNPFLGRNKTW